MNTQGQKKITTNWQGAWPCPPEPPSLVLVGGAARAGTTLAQAILCSDPRVNPLIEESVPLRLLVETYLKNLAHQKRFPGAYFKDTHEVRRFYREQILGFFKSVRKRYGCKRLVLKEPALTRLFPVLFELIPESAAVCMVRDPRAAIASMLNWGERMASEGKRHFFNNRDMNELSKFFNSFYLPLFQSESSFPWDRVAFLRFEDLLDEPKDHVKRLSDFTRLVLDGYDPAAPWPRSAIDFRDDSLPQRAAVTPFYGQPIQADEAKPDKFMSVLRKREIKHIEKYCYLIMRTFDYRAFNEIASSGRH